MRRALVILTLLLPVLCQAGPAGGRVSGRVLDADSGDALVGVVLSLGEDYLWAVSAADGEFLFENVQRGRYVLKASCLGYVDTSLELDASRDLDSLVILMSVSSLALDEVVVTAQRPKDGLSTSHTLGREAMDHLQMSNMADMVALLPGGKTVNPDLTSANALSLRAGGSSEANAAFGTALEIDGVRMGNNAGLAGMNGMDTRSLSVDNIESVEVITGVPSAEYGDLNSGMVKVNTRKGRSPYSVSVSVNPRTWQFSASKGFDLQKDRGVLNASLEWARATKQLISPYESYTRRGITLNYSNTFARKLRFEAGISGNIGGMNSKDDPDAYSGEYSKVRDNVFRGNVAMTFLANKSWITNLKWDFSVCFQDNLSHTHGYNDYASHKPAVHSEKEGYYLASSLPLNWFSDYIVDSKELDLASELKYEWTRRWGGLDSRLKAGLQWKANGNVGRGEYYLDPELADDGFRPRSYIQYPFMHNLSAYVEERLKLPVGETKLDLSAGLRMEKVFIEGSPYRHTVTWSPRLNLRWELGRHFAIRGGWGITEKLPSFFILYPKQEYWDKETFQLSYGDNSAYVYYTLPYTTVYNPELRWQRNSNSEFALEMEFGDFSLSAVGFCNVTRNPYRLIDSYTPFSYTMWTKPEGWSAPEDAQIKVDRRSGEVFIRGGENEFWTAMVPGITDKTFVKNTMQGNGRDMYRAGAELTVDFPEIKPIRTSFRADASYSWTRYRDDSLGSYYRGGSHSSISGRSYEFVGIYPNGYKGNSLVCGRISHNIDANLTAITHIPQARLVITCRLEMSLLNRSRNLAAPGAQANSEGYMELWPQSFLSVEDGQLYEFTEDMKSDPQYRNLMLTASNIYTFAQDGYGFYCSANLSITKEIGKHLSLSFFANNFTNSRPYVISKATGVGAILTPAFYYGLTCRLKF